MVPTTAPGVSCYLMVCASDVYWGDNVDPEGDFAIDVAAAGMQTTTMGPSRYRSWYDSPLLAYSNWSYWHLDDFEDGLLNVPGVTASVPAPYVGAPYGPAYDADSVDADDGLIDGLGRQGRSFFAGGWNVTFTFDVVALGRLPTHVGVVFTDGTDATTFRAYDQNGVQIASIGPVSLADNTYNGTTADDYFLGVVHYAGVHRVYIGSPGGGIEVDHLQYGDGPTAIARTVPFDAFGSALFAEASFSTPLLYFPPSSTCNAVNAGASWQLSSSPQLYDAWSPMGNHWNDNYIAWTFHGGSRSVHAMQLLNNYDPALAAINGPHYLLHFSLDYTTDPSPSLQSSTWLPLSGLSASVGGATIAGNEVTYPSVGYPNLSDLRVYFQPTNATAVRLHSYPNGGSNLNYVLTEVAFAATVPGLQLAGASSPGCTGPVRLTTNGPPSLGDASFAWQCANAPASGFGALLLSLFPLQQAIPIQGVNIYVQPFNVVSLLTLVTDWGTAATPFSLPGNPAYLGIGISGQYLWFDPCGSQGLTASNAGRIVLQ